MLTLFILSVLFYTEAWLEEIVIFLKIPLLTPIEQNANKQEHFRSAVFALLLITIACLYLVFETQEYFIIPAAIINRRIFFDYVLAKRRDRPKKVYEGNDWWVVQFKKIFGPNGRMLEHYVECGITIACIVLTVIF